MVIQDSTVALKSFSDYQRTSARWTAAIDSNAQGGVAGTFEGEVTQERAQRFDSLSFSQGGLKMLELSKPNNDSPLMVDDAEIKLLLIEQFLRQLGNMDGDHSGLSGDLNAKIKQMRDARQGKGNQGACPVPQQLNTSQVVRGAPSATRRVINTSELHISNSMSFSAAAKIRTGDGREIDIAISLNMSQEYYERNSSELQRSLCDPLVINLEGASVNLSSRTFSFDLDADGTADQISRLAKGSGFLAYDKNGDGRINDGTELFGAQSGNGFADLAAYDDDGNGWIDEKDAIFDKLRIWLNNDDGTSTLIGLGQAGVGAIFLGSASGNWLLGSLANPDGVVRSTGMFLFEDGRAGTMQQLDLAV